MTGRDSGGYVAGYKLGRIEDPVTGTPNNVAELLEQVRGEVMKTRASRGLKPCKPSGHLFRAAQIQANLAASFRPEMDTAEVLQKVGYVCDDFVQLVGGDSIEPMEITDRWIADPGTRDTLCGDYTDYGAGICGGPYGVRFYVMLAKRAAAPLPHLPAVDEGQIEPIALRDGLSFRRDPF